MTKIDLFNHKPSAEIAGLMLGDDAKSMIPQQATTIAPIEVGMIHEIQARRQRGNVFILVIPAKLVKINTDYVKFILNQTDGGFDCTCEKCKVF